MFFDFPLILLRDSCLVSDRIVGSFKLASISYIRIEALFWMTESWLSDSAGKTRRPFDI
jgi:hypothetical protein